MYSFKPSQFLLVACLGLQVNRLNVESSNLTLEVSLPLSYQLSNLQSATLQTCPADVETLTSQLIRDLPSYANRVIQRSRRLNRTVDSFSYVLVAGKPEFAPLSLGPGQYSSAASVADVEPPKQVFITTLERQYLGGKAIESQHYHWLFLTQTPGGWRLALMFSRIGSSSPGRSPTPPRESSKGVIGQAVTIWLRDCRAGAIRPSS